MKKFKIVSGLVLAGVLAGTLAGCGTNNANSSTTSTNNGKTIGFAVSTLNNPFFVAMKNGVEKEANKEGLKVVVQNGNNDSATQLNQVQNLIQQKVSVIILNPTDSKSLSSAVKMANDANIPVITLDRSVDSGKVATFIASNNIDAGKEAAKQIATALKSGGEVVELQGIIGTSAERDRESGFDTEIAKSENIKIVAKQAADFDRSKAMNVVQNILQAHPNVKAIFAQNDEMALGALKAVQEAGKSGIAIVGIDGEQEAIDDVNQGKLYADIAQQPEQEGVLGVQNAAKLIKGQTTTPQVDSPLQTVNKGSQFKGF
jgi:ribose transport system substrate-binding protein